MKERMSEESCLMIHPFTPLAGSIHPLAQEREPRQNKNHGPHMLFYFFAEVRRNWQEKAPIFCSHCTLIFQREIGSNTRKVKTFPNLFLSWYLIIWVEQDIIKSFKLIFS